VRAAPAEPTHPPHSAHSDAFALIKPLTRQLIRKMSQLIRFRKTHPPTHWHLIRRPAAVLAARHLAPPSDYYDE
jgi:hypothetical protein